MQRHSEESTAVLEKLRVIFTIPELRQKILLTLGLLAIYRIGWQVPRSFSSTAVDSSE